MGLPCIQARPEAVRGVRLSGTGGQLRREQGLWRTALQRFQLGRLSHLEASRAPGVPRRPDQPARRTAVAPILLELGRAAWLGLGPRIESRSAGDRPDRGSLDVAASRGPAFRARLRGSPCDGLYRARCSSTGRVPETGPRHSAGIVLFQGHGSSAAAVDSYGGGGWWVRTAPRTIADFIACQLISAVAGCPNAVGSIDQWFDLAVKVLRIGFEAQEQAGVGVSSRV